MTISIIIPVYNTVGYLDKCLSSIVNQTYKELEIICVDDGSTDGSAEKLDELAKTDKRIKVIHKENGGSVSARKKGVEVATGTYIGYVDSDDYIEKDMFETLFKIAEKHQVDIVSSGYFREGDYITEHKDTVEGGLYDEKSMHKLRENLIYCEGKRETGLRGSLCCKLFKADIFRDVQLSIPDYITTAEDKSCLLTFFLQCRSAYVLKKSFYHWVIRNSSKSQKKNDDYLLKVHNVCTYWKTLYKHPNFSARMIKQAEVYYIELLFLGINTRMGFENRNMIWIDPYWLEQIPENVRVVLYGGGELGEKYQKQLFHLRPDIIFVGCVDPQYERISGNHLEIHSPDKLGEWEYDYVVITIKNKGKALEVKRELTESGVGIDRIIWCEQPEAYWRYIEAEGVI